MKQILEEKKKNNSSIEKAISEIHNSRWKVWFSWHFFSYPRFFCIQPNIIVATSGIIPPPPKLEKQRRELSMILRDYFRIWRCVENIIHKTTSRIRQLRSGNGLAVKERNSANKYQCDLSVIPSYTISFILKKNCWASEINMTHTLTSWTSSMANTVRKIKSNHNLNRKLLCNSSV